MNELKKHSHLKHLADEAIYIMREVEAQFDRPVLFFSGGRFDSNVHLALKSFYPGNIPFALMHIDTGHNFPEAIEFKDKFVEKHCVELFVGYVQDHP